MSNNIFIRYENDWALRSALFSIYHSTQIPF